MATKSVAVRLGTEGKVQVQNDFAEIRKAGEDTSAALADAAEKGADRAAAAAERAAERQQAGYAKLAAAGMAANAAAASQGATDSALGTRGSASQFATVNLDRSAGAARASADVFAAQFKAEEDATNAALKLKAALDPLWAAQQRYDDEIRTHNSLLAQGAIGEDLHGKAIADSARRLREAEQALAGHSNALGLNRMQFIIGASAAHRFVDSVLAGASPMRAFMMQAGDVATVLQMDDGGVAGGLAKVRALLTPVTLGIAGATLAVAAGAAAYLDYANAMDKMQALSQGAGAVIGATGSSLEASAVSAAKAGGISVAAARDIEEGYVKLGGIGKDVLGPLTGLTKDFAAATGQDANAAVQQLGAAFKDPVKGAEDLTERYGFLTQAQIEHIRELVTQNDLYGAQAALLDDLKAPLDGAADHVNILVQAWRDVKNAASDAFTAMGRSIDLALGGGSTADRLSQLQEQRRTVAQQRGGAIGTADLDAKIAALQTQLQQEQQNNGAGARSRGAKAMQIVDSATGGDALSGLQAKLGAVNGLLADNGKAAGLTAEQLARARTAQDQYTHAVSTYIPEGEKQARIAALDAQIAQAKGPVEKDRLTAQKTRIENSGKLITTAQSEAEAVGKGAAARATAAKSGEGHAATLAREAAAMEISTRAALDVADAYLQSSAAGQQAEARRKALTAATKSGADLDAQVKRQLALETADAIVAADKSTATMRDEASARAQVNADVLAGKLAVADMNDALAAETALRSLTARLATTAEGPARQRLVDAIDAEKAALEKLNAEKVTSQHLTDMQAIADRNAASKITSIFAGDTTGARDIALARLQAQQKARDDKKNPDQTKEFVDESVAAKQAELDASRLDYVAGIARSQRDQNELTSEELRLVGKTDTVREKTLDRLKIEQDLRSRGVDLASDEAQKILQASDAQVDLNHALDKANVAMSSLRDIGGQVVDDVLDKSNWTSWGDLGKRVIADIENAFIKLALINPLKNLINGNGGLPTLSSIFGSVGKLFGGGVSTTSSSLSAPITYTAAGSEYFTGGMTWVAENGPELVNLPRGSKVTPAPQTRRLLSANDNGGAVHNHFHLNGSVLTQDLVDQMNTIGEGASVSGAMGGSAMAQAAIARRGGRRLGRG